MSLSMHIELFHHQFDRCIDQPLIHLTISDFSILTFDPNEIPIKLNGNTMSSALSRQHCQTQIQLNRSFFCMPYSGHSVVRCWIVSVDVE